MGGGSVTGADGRSVAGSVGGGGGGGGGVGGGVGAAEVVRRVANDALRPAVGGGGRLGELQALCAQSDPELRVGFEYILEVLSSAPMQVPCPSRSRSRPSLLRPPPFLRRHVPSPSLESGTSLRPPPKRPSAHPSASPRLPSKRPPTSPLPPHPPPPSTERRPRRCGFLLAPSTSHGGCRQR